MDYYHFPDYEPEDENNNIQNQNIEGKVSNSNVTQSGRDTYINSQVSHTYYYTLSPSEFLGSLNTLRGSRTNNIINHILAFFLLLGVGVGWFLLGLFTNCKFPLPYIFNVMKALLTPEQEKKLKCDEYNQNNLEKDRFYYLHNQESQIWLLSQVIAILSEGKQDPELRILEAIEKLEDIRDDISQELEVLKNKYYPNLVKAQSNLDIIFSRHNKDLELIQKLIKKIIRKYIKISRKASPEEIKAFIRDVDEALHKNKININPSHLKILNEIKNLAIWLLPIKEGIKFSDVRVLIPYKGNKKNKFHFYRLCDDFPNLGEREIKYFLSWEDAKANGYEPCEKCTKLDT